MSEREPITVELRELMGGVEPRVGEDGVVTAKYVTPEAWAEFARRCDAIDAVHAQLERENAELRAKLDNIGESMHDGWVRLPLDADGVPIRFGDKVTVSWSEKVYEVSGFSYTQQLAGGERTIWVDVYSLEKMGNVPLCGASGCRHYHAPTVEDVLREFGIDWEYEDNCEDRAALLAEYASKLRLAGDAETCQQEERGWTTEGDHARVFLTCGHDCMVETVADLPNFCPVCGARVEAAE